MSTTTDYLKLHKPELTDPADITQMNQNWDDLDTAIYERQIKTYTDITQIGLVVGSETIESICQALPQHTKLRYAVTTSHNATIYPYSTGTVEFRKSVSGYTDITFWSYSTVASKRGTWNAKAYYTNSQWNFYGWGKNYDENNNPLPSTIGAIPYTADRIDIQDNADLNTFLTVGCYRCTTNVRALTLTNCPVEVAFTLDIVPGMGYHEQVATSNGTIIQKLTTHFGDFYYRRVQNVDGTINYDTWTQSYDERHKPTPAEIGAMADSIVPIKKGGTGATDVATARTNLGIKSGSYTGNNDNGLNLTLGASNSNVIFIWHYDGTKGHDYKAMLTPQGGFAFGDSSGVDGIWNPDQAYYANGKLWCKSGLADATINNVHLKALNHSNGTYYYQTL